MSHFSVMVIGEDPEEQLEPYWELDLPYEDIKHDRRAEFVDCTEEVDERWEGTTTAVRMPDGRILLPWDEAFRVESSVGLSNASHKVLEPLKEEEVPTKEYAESKGQTKKGWVKDWYGYHYHKGMWGYWHNPNAKWDWYVLGGRWRGYFKTKGDSHSDLGDAGWASPNGDMTDKADQLLKGDIDLEGMYAEAMDEASEVYDEFEKVTEGLEIPPRWEEVRKMFPDDIDAARKAYGSYPFVKAVRKAHLDPWSAETLDHYFVNQGGREKYIENSKCECLIPFAFVMDGEWYEKGEMGWWGMVTDEKLKYDWSAKFMELWEELSDDTLISMFDCHI